MPLMLWVHSDTAKKCSSIRLRNNWTCKAHNLVAVHSYYKRRAILHISNNILFPLRILQGSKRCFKPCM
ncbi:hypothetical protein D3C71_2059680 [compost metagenome]